MKTDDRGVVTRRRVSEPNQRGIPLKTCEFHRQGPPEPGFARREAHFGEENVRTQQTAADSPAACITQTI
jgi:hypothetical protein